MKPLGDMCTNLATGILGGTLLDASVEANSSSFPSALDAIPPDAPGFEASNYRPSSRNAIWKSMFRRVWLVNSEWKSPEYSYG